MLRQPKVSIIVPVYNGEKYLEKNILSLTSQSMQDLEFIYVNDASSDNSLNIIKDYQKNDERIKFINLKNNLRQGGARNRGIREAKAKYIMFVDCDDTVSSEICEKLYCLINSSEADISVCSIERIFKGESIILNEVEDFKSIPENELKRKLAFKSQPGPVAKLIKRDLIIKNDLFFPECISYEDAAIVPSWFLFAQNITYINEPLYQYIIYPFSTTQKKSFTHFNRVNAMEYLKSKITEDIWRDYCKDFYEYFYYHGWLCLLNNAISQIPRNQNNRMKEAKKRILHLCNNDLSFKTRKQISKQQPLHTRFLARAYDCSNSVGSLFLTLFRAIHDLKIWFGK